MKTCSLIFCFCIFSGIYLQAANFNGDINVGTGQAYTSLTQNDASGLFKAINEGTVTGNITIYITSDITETGAIPLNAFTGPYTITIRPDAPQLRNISGQNFNARGLVRFDGADRVTIDGSYDNTGNYLLFYNYASQGHIMTLQLQSDGAGAGCTDFVIRNCKFQTGSTGSPASNTMDIQVGGMNPLDGGADNSNILIENNAFDKAYYGLFIKGISGYKADGITINNNNFGTNQNSIGYNSILVLEATNVQITNNTITGYTINTNLTGGQKGIFLINSTNTTISGNHMYGMKSVLSGSKGITISYSSNVNINNNLVYDIGGPGYHNISSENPNNIGISIDGTSASVNIYYNTINLFGNFNKPMATISAALYLSSECSGINLKDNILTNKILNNSTSSARCYSIYNAGNSGVYSSTNYNDYYGSGAQFVLGYLAGDKTTLSDWQSATGSDLQSLGLDPQFQSDTQLQPNPGSPVLAAGIPIAGITADIENETRSATNPSMGAYELAVALPAVDWCNIQSPGSDSRPEGLTMLVKAQVEEAGVTEAAGEGANIEAWIGWSEENTDPNTWTNWDIATYVQDDGNRDEYQAAISGWFDPGSYYFASRFRVNNGDFRYGGYSVSGGGFWDGNVNNSGQLIVTDNAIEWVNLEEPGNVTITQGDPILAKALIKVPMVTTLSNESPGIYCEIGIGYEDTNPDSWPEWQWQQATFLERQGDRHLYTLDISSLSPGNYYLASRFYLCDDPVIYGGYSAAGGGFWDGITNVSGILNVNQLVVNAPYSQNFNTNSLMPLGWSVEDANNDGINWENVSDHMEIGYNDAEAMNDWLFSPGINMQAGVTYTIDFSYGTGSDTYIEKLELEYGSSPFSADMLENSGFSDINIINGYKNGHAEITPPATGIYFLGWHGFSDPDQAYLELDDVVIEITDGWTGLVNQYWSNPNNWATGQVPTATSNVEIQSPKQVIVDLPHASCKNITIRPGAKLTIDPAMGLEVHGTLTNQNGEAGLLIKSDGTGTGSLLHHTAGVEGVFQRYITGADWSVGTDGWHFISSPVNMQPIAGSWTPTAVDDDYDFYLWDSEGVQWLNQKDPANGITTFNRGVGYLAAYQQTKTQTFSGTLFAGDFTSDLPINEDSWIPLGNPYATALQWNTEDWMLDGYADIAKVWNRDMKSYIDLFPGDIIPATNGFMGFGQGIGALVHIQMGMPASAWVINSTPFYKSAGQEGLYMSVREKFGTATQECNIVKHEHASEMFNKQCDSYFNAGYAPQFYAIKAGKSLSTFAVQDLNDHEIELGFIKNQTDQFELVLDTLRSKAGQNVFVTDLKTGITQNLAKNPVYSFSSEAADEPKRFILKLATLGQNESETNEVPEIYSYGQQIYISGATPGTLLQVLDINGRLMKEYYADNSEMSSFNLSLPAGVYIIRSAGKGFVKSVKIILI